MKERNRGVSHQLAITLMLLLAAFLRLWNLGSSAFTFDSAYLSNLAARFLSTGVPPAQGMVSSVGIVNPPLAVYLISLPVLLSRDPRVVTGFVAVANVIAVWECYLVGRRYWGHWQGTLAALLLVVSPWAVYYSRGVAAQELLLPGVILLFALILRWLVDHKSWAVVGATFTLAALVQIHFAALALAPVLAAVLLASAVARVRDRRGLWPRKPLVVGTVAGALWVSAGWKWKHLR
jgi:asparagine N-glycosylation enzyme membrane subunit Stt3